jgi:MtN3 and saliva related transmembrane protein
VTLPDVLGMIAGTLTTIAFVPQVVKTWRSKSTHDISYGMFILFSLGLLLWLAYGIVIDAMPIIVSNLVTLVLALVILGLKFRYK